MQQLVFSTYESSVTAPGIAVGDEVHARGERFVVYKVDATATDTTVLLVTSLVDGREAILLGARPGRPQEWTVHIRRGRTGK